MKKILVFFIILTLLISAVIIYLNSVLLPKKIKNLLVDQLREATAKQVTLGSLQFNIFKGLVIRDLRVEDDKGQLLNLKEGSCTFLIIPLIKKNLIIPDLRLRSPEIFLERFQDNTFNLAPLWGGKAENPSSKPGFIFIVNKVSILKGRVHFKDKTQAPPFTAEIEDMDFISRLTLPAAATFDLTARVVLPAQKPLLIDASGRYEIPGKVLKAQVRFKDLDPRSFLAYLPRLGIQVNQGALDGAVDLEFKQNTLYADLEVMARGVSFLRDTFSGLLNADIKMSLLYELENKQFGFSGKAKVFDSSVEGPSFAGGLKNVSGDLYFNDSEVSSENLTATVWDMPFQGKASLNDFRASPRLTMSLFSKTQLETLPAALKENSWVPFIEGMKGEGIFSLELKMSVPPTKELKLNGFLDLLGVDLKIEKVDLPFEGIKGKIEFNESGASWPKLLFKYKEFPYEASGALNDFSAPRVQLVLTSAQISLDSDFSIDKSVMKLSKATGQYLDSTFSLTGQVDASQENKWIADIKGEGNVDLKDLPGLEKMKPAGLVRATQLSLKGDLKDLRNCAIQAQLSSDGFSLYGYKAGPSELTYEQNSGHVQVSQARFSLYDGILEASATMNLLEKDPSYAGLLNIQGVRLEKIKLDTPAKDKEIAGSVNAQAHINGTRDDPARMNGEGKIAITEGKLWELNLFQGLGSVLFAKDFAKIVFSEGSCDFVIKDKSVATDNLMLKSDITNLAGTVKIGFDSSIDASINVQVLSENAPLTGTFKDITTAIVGQGGVFGVIKVSGTLKEPKFKFQAAVMNILKGLKDTFLGQR
jgi:hypothetical protein